MSNSADIIAYAYDANCWCSDHLPVSSDHPEVSPIFEDNSSEWDEGLYCAEPNCDNNPLIENPHWVTIRDGEKELVLRLDIQQANTEAMDYFGHQQYALEISPPYVTALLQGSAEFDVYLDEPVNYFDNDRAMEWLRTECNIVTEWSSFEEYWKEEGESYNIRREAGRARWEHSLAVKETLQQLLGYHWYAVFIKS